MSQAPPFRYVGHSILRREGLGKVTGRARYVDDIPVGTALHGKTIRSTISAGRIKSINFGEGVPWNEFTIVDASDVPKNIVALIIHDQPVLCDGIVRHREEAILLIAHEDQEMVERAAKAITIEYEREEPILTIGPGAVQKKYDLSEGDVEKEFAESDVIFEGVYTTGAQEHVYIEPNGFIAEWTGKKLILRGSLQCPYYVQKAITHALELTDDQVDVQQETTGGGFGGKEDFPSIVALHAALLACKSGRAVRMIYNRHEDMAASTKRHPSISRIKTGCTKDGILKVLEFEFCIDGGAYVTLSPVVLSRGIVHSFGPYRWRAAHLHGKSHFTNSPPYGAFRGFGAPQSLFAMEMHMNRLADHLGIDPVTLRKKNFITQGDMLPTGQVLQEEPELEKMLDRALKLSGYHEKMKRCGKDQNYGLGISVVLHGTGFTGSGEAYLKSRVAIATRLDGTAEVLVASTEIGQGTETVFCQIAAEELGIPIDEVNFHAPQTSVVPNSGPTVASRTCTIVGRLVQRAAGELKARLNGQTIAQRVAAHGVERIEVEYVPPPGIVWDEVAYKGSAYGAYSWMCTVAEVTVDPITSAAKVESLSTTVDIGRVINPTLAKGQVEGALAQGTGWATTEQVVLRDGIMANGQMTNYIIPTTMDTPSFVVDFFERPYSEGAFGAKGVGELPLDAPGPAVLHAINVATGADMMSIPATPEAILAAKNKESHA